MDKKTKKLGLIIIAVVLVLSAFAAFFTLNNPTKIVANPTPTIVSEKAPEQTNTFSYKGQEGRDALTLLKNTTSVEQNSSGLVTSINGRVAEDAKKEFWAFYVNGEMAPVGPAEYQTKNEDNIEWKIETY